MQLIQRTAEASFRASLSFASHLLGRFLILPPAAEDQNHLVQPFCSEPPLGKRGALPLTSGCVMIMFSAGILVFRVNVFVLRQPGPLPSPAVRDELRRNKLLIFKDREISVGSINAKYVQLPKGACYPHFSFTSGLFFSPSYMFSIIESILRTLIARWSRCFHHCQICGIRKLAVMLLAPSFPHLHADPRAAEP